MLLLVLVYTTISTSNASGIMGFSQQDARGAIIAAEASGQEAFVKIQAADREGGKCDIPSQQIQSSFGNAAAEASNRRMVILLAAPLIVIALTLSSYFAISLWRMWLIKRTMEMEVRESEAK